MDKLINEIVDVRVTEAAQAATATSVNTVAILGETPVSGAKTTVQYDQAGVEAAYNSGETNSEIAKVSRSFFLENSNPGKLVCIPTAEAPTVETIAGLLDGALELGKDANGRTIDFYHVIYRVPSTATAEDVIAMIEGSSDDVGLEDWAIENSKLVHLEFAKRETAEEVIGDLTKELTRVAFYYHSEATEKSFAAALVADRCGRDPARGTWAHKPLTSISTDSTTKAQLKDAKEKGLNIYPMIAGVGRTLEGFIAGGKSFIDSVIKKDWVKFRVQEAIFNLLGSANDGYGVDFTDGGIIAIAAEANSILNIAQDGEHQYVLPDSAEVQYPKYADISAEDKEKRNLPLLKILFSVQESIHTVKTVEMQITK